MATFNVYRYRTRSRAKSGVIRVWQGEARDETQAVVLAAQARPGMARFQALFARDARDDPYAGHAIIEEEG